uniref:Uncharacterized protein n=1 Tax=Anopheles atroparvus TaxID=41427 RepID=A0A182JFS3_ANOAO
MAATLPCGAPRSACAILIRADSHPTASSSPLGLRSIGAISRWRFSPSQAKRDLSDSHSSLMASFSRGSMRSTSPVRVPTTMLLPSASSTSIDSVLRISHGRATKLYGLLVSAPTGHRSITLPDSSERNSFSTYVPTCISSPRPVVPKSSTPATSDAKRMQRVQWMHRVMMVLISGPMSLSSTARLPVCCISVKRDRSEPNAIAWSWRSHSPPWSQMGQSSGWFISRNSMTPSRALRVISELVWMRQPFITGMAQAATGLVAGHREPLVVAEARNFDTNLCRGLQHRGARIHHHRLAVDEHFDLFRQLRSQGALALAPEWCFEGFGKNSASSVAKESCETAIEVCHAVRGIEDRPEHEQAGAGMDFKLVICTNRLGKRQKHSDRIANALPVQPGKRSS